MSRGVSLGSASSRPSRTHHGPPPHAGGARGGLAPGFGEFDLRPAAAASLGQVHRAASLSGERLACKLQYPDMASAVETDLAQLDLVFSLHRRVGAAIDTREIAREIRERVREELDYQREAKIARLYRIMLADRPYVRVPGVEAGLSTRRLLTLNGSMASRCRLRGRASETARDTSRSGCSRRGGARSCATASSTAIPTSATIPLSRPVGGERRVEGINLFDYGCVRIFRRGSSAGVVELYQRSQVERRRPHRQAYGCGASPILHGDAMKAMKLWAASCARRFSTTACAASPTV